jgi:hypothetical protein
MIARQGKHKAYGLFNLLAKDVRKRPLVLLVLPITSRAARKFQIKYISLEKSVISSLT